MITTVISGGQTGVDRAALDIALELGIDHGGFCPKGRLAEDGPIPLIYNLKETGSKSYQYRTEKNVLAATGTLLLYRGPFVSGGTLLTKSYADRHKKPLIPYELIGEPGIGLISQVMISQFCNWATEHNIKTLNVAGPRESKFPGAYLMAKGYLRLFLIYHNKLGNS